MNSLLYNTIQDDQQRMQDNLLQLQQQNQQTGSGLLNISSFLPQQEETSGQPPMGAGGDYTGTIQKGLGLYDKFAGTNYGGYAAAATTFGKFVDSAFDKDSPLGGIGRRNVHWLEDGFREVKDGIKAVPGIKEGLGVIKDVGSDISDFFSKIF